MDIRKKLIETVMPLEAISQASGQENIMLAGMLGEPFFHPGCLQIWWGRRTAALARAITFASLIDDPSGRPDVFKTFQAQETERKRLAGLIEKMIQWENYADETCLEEVRREIAGACQPPLPRFEDHFTGGGLLALEAQRLGLPVSGSDLHPVAVLLGRAMLEYPVLFAGRPAVSPPADPPGSLKTGLARDTAYYGRSLIEAARRELAPLYPKIPWTDPEGRRVLLEPAAWFWAWSVRCPSPDCGCQMPLIYSFDLSRIKGAEFHLEPLNDGREIRFEVRSGLSGQKGTVGRQGAKCAACGTAVSLEYIAQEATAGRMKPMLTAAAAELNGRILYLPPEAAAGGAAAAAGKAAQAFIPDSEFPAQALGLDLARYGFSRHRDLYTSRQLTLLSTLVRLTGGLLRTAEEDARQHGFQAGGPGLSEGGTGALAYSQALAVYLSFVISNAAAFNSIYASWNPASEKIRSMFAKQPLVMLWNFAEVNPFSRIQGGLGSLAEAAAGALDGFPARGEAEIVLQDAHQSFPEAENSLTAIDPPYYSDLAYADPADLFYAWQRLSLKDFMPMFEPLYSQKDGELIAAPERFQGDSRKARDFYEDNLRQVLKNLSRSASFSWPVTVIASSQTASPGVTGRKSCLGPASLEAFLSLVQESGLSVTAAWPFHPYSHHSMSLTNAQNSALILVCRKSSPRTPGSDTQQFLEHLKTEMNHALNRLVASNIPPQDLYLAAVGQGLGVYTRISESSGKSYKSLEPKTALPAINSLLERYLARIEPNLDLQSSLCIALLIEGGFAKQPLAKAAAAARKLKIKPETLTLSGLAQIQDDFFWLRGSKGIPLDTKPNETSIWLLVHQLAWYMQTEGISGLARAAAPYIGKEPLMIARFLVYWIHHICVRRKMDSHAEIYNKLAVSWPKMLAAAPKKPAAGRSAR
ncbi:MAG: DUF1156 domain-containing protein [Deltaproteobacteria bacterium]|jgi:putative DNA methylase|nr:DUF1156 domain-containing protein [Deltaproteobacteria bacterium]